MIERAASSARTALIALALVAPGAAAAEEDRFHQPVMGHSSSPDEHEAKSENPNDLEGHSRNPCSLLGHSSDPDDHLEQAEDPNDLEAYAEDLADHEGHTEALQDLPGAETFDARVKREEAAQVPSPDAQRLREQIRTVETAKKDLTILQGRVKELDHAYNDMIHNDYPRGEERQELIDAREAAHQQLEVVQKRYEDLLSGSAGDPANGRW